MDFPLKIFENIVIVDFPFSFYSGFSFIVDFHGTPEGVQWAVPGWQSSRHWKFLPLARVWNDIVYEPKASIQCHSLQEQEEEISNACETATQE